MRATAFSFLIVVSLNLAHFGFMRNIEITSPNAIETVFVTNEKATISSGIERYK